MYSEYPTNNLRNAWADAVESFIDSISAEPDWLSRLSSDFAAFSEYVPDFIKAFGIDPDDCHVIYDAFRDKVWDEIDRRQRDSFKRWVSQSGIAVDLTTLPDGHFAKTETGLLFKAFLAGIESTF